MRLLLAAILASIAVIAVAAEAQADPANYGIESVGASLTTTQAGAHPDFTSSIVLKTENFELPALTRDVSVELPPGLLANPNAAPKCSASQFVRTNVEEKSNVNGCPQDSQVGVTHIIFSNEHEGTADVVEPVFNLVPRAGEPARLGFIALQYPILIDTELRPDYGITATVEGADTLATLYTTETTLWGVPADESHDDERMTPYEAAHNRSGIETPTGTRTSGLAPVPFMLSPTRCGEGSAIRGAVDSYQEPERVSEATATLPALSGCSLLDFSPVLSLTPTAHSATTASGLDANLSFPTAGLEHPNMLAEDEQKRVEVTLPEGVTVNPSQADGLAACSEADFDAESLASAPGAGCPEASKIGNASARSPLLDEEVTGALYVATPNANPFGSLIAVYLVLKLPERGVLVKLAGKVVADPVTGQLTATFGEAPYPIPQLPVATFHLHFREGPRAPLVTPPACGPYTAAAKFSSWGANAASLEPGFTIDQGAGGGACPSATEPFRPGFEAGAINNDAGSISPYQLRYSRTDADQYLSRFSTALPPGSLAKLAGVGECSAQDLAKAALRSGAAELAAPSCPATAEIGHLFAGAGVGSVLTYVPGLLYLAGPYRGEPLSIAAVVPAVAGPFDLGTVVVRVALRINPNTGVAEVDGSRSDALPSILDGIPLRVRDVRVDVDRPDFTINPTSCDPEKFSARLWGAGHDPASPADDTPADLSARFQAANCSRLPFKPRLSLTLKGSTKRTSHPRLLANLTAKPGEANIARAQVKLPKAAFLDNAHIKGICTRVQFAADSCPANSIYGKASAKTPLLDSPLKGAVYLRSSNNPLPDLVAKLRGPDSQPIEIDLAGRTDSVKGALRNTFEAVPDAPVSTFQLELFGGKRGLIELSSGLCKSPKASVKLEGQNGKAYETTPVVGSSCKRPKEDVGPPAHGRQALAPRSDEVRGGP